MNPHGLINERYDPLPRQSTSAPVTHGDDSHVPLAAFKTWRFWHYGALWSTLSISIRTYMLASGLLRMGLNYWQALLCVGMGNLVSAVLLCLTSLPAAKYGVSYPQLMKSSFGYVGNKLAILLRGIVNLVFFSFESFIGSQCLFSMVAVFRPRMGSSPKLPFFGISVMQLLCLILFIIICVSVPTIGGIRAVRTLNLIGAPVMFVAALCLLIWGIATVGFGSMLNATYHIDKSITNLGIILSVGAIVGNWSAMLLNVTEFSRYSKTQYDHIVGAVIFMPIVMTAFAFVSIALTGAGYILYDEVFWSPVSLVSRFESPTLAIGSIMIIAFGIICSNIAGNLVSSAADMANIFPIGAKIAYIAVGFLGIFICPWVLFSQPELYVDGWLILSSGICASLTALLLVDSFPTRRMVLNIGTGTRPLVFKSVFSLLISQIVVIPWPLSQLGLLPFIDNFDIIFAHTYHASFFVCFFLTISIYYILKVSYSGWKRRGALVDAQEWWWRKVHIFQEYHWATRGERTQLSQA